MFTWSDVPQKASSGSGQGDSSPEEDGQDEVGEQGREPNHLGKKTGCLISKISINFSIEKFWFLIFLYVVTLIFQNLTFTNRDVIAIFKV